MKIDNGTGGSRETSTDGSGPRPRRSDVDERGRESISFFAELKRRNVYKVAVAYAVVGWLTIQVSSTVLPTFHAPEWVVQTLMVLVAIGFPIALIIAWAFELTPEGLKRTEDVDLAASARQPRKHTWIFVVVVGAALSVGLFFIGRYTARNTAGGARTEALTASSIPQKSIAVLPFENLSDDKSAAYFADGIQDEILTKLASIADLKVISRTSTAKYKSKPEDLKTVSQQLGVANVLEGSVQKAADKVRVNVQLIDARADSHLWAKTYDRDLADVFAIQSEVAQEIADSLKAKLSPSEANTMASAPTKDMQAYDLFLKGEFEQRVANSNFRPESFDQAARWYREAIALDPNFALAIAELAICQLRRHWLTDPLSEAELMEAGTLAKQALTLAPSLPEAHVAGGLFHYYGFRQYDQALTEFQRALELRPNYSLALQFIAFVHRRQGKWDRTVDELKKSIVQDPGDPYVQGGLAETYVFLRMWKEAEDIARHALTIDPHEATAMRMLLLSSLNRTGNAQEPLRLLATFPPDDLLLPNTGMFDMVIGTRGETLSWPAISKRH
jgi:TolB-like protein/predicted Zn-dependent protease